MHAKDVLRQLDLGSSVAEHDTALERYFVETETFRDLIQGKADVIAGDKGTGKTALFRILRDRFPLLPELKDIEVVAGFNPTGSPVFQRLTEGDALTEGQYSTIWKGYLLALVGNWLLDLEAPAQYTDLMKELDGLLSRVGLRSADDSPSTVFSQIVNLFRRITNPQSLEAAVTITPGGLPVVVPKIVFSDEAGTLGQAEVVEHEAAFNVLDRTLEELGITIWVVMDRLDEAFQGFPAAEVPALRALFRTYLDLQQFEHLRVKLFVRRDLFSRIIAGGFVNLTHINARKIEILWDERDLYDLLCRRMRESDALVETLGAGDECDPLFAAIFPDQVDVGDRKPTTWTWMMSRIRDGNGVRPPRNLIDLVTQAKTAQLRRDEQQGRDYVSGVPLIASESIKRGLQRLSAERVQDTLLAEAGLHAPLVQLFEGGKSEHNQESLAEVLGGDAGEMREKIKVLETLGFLEQVGDTFKVPILYRDGMGITQGKAF